MVLKVKVIKVTFYFNTHFSSAMNCQEYSLDFCNIKTGLYLNNPLIFLCSIETQIPSPV